MHYKASLFRPVQRSPYWRNEVVTLHSVDAEADFYLPYVIQHWRLAYITGNGVYAPGQEGVHSTRK
jgi:hypothetical protein